MGHTCDVRLLVIVITRYISTLILTYSIIYINVSLIYIYININILRVNISPNHETTSKLVVMLHITFSLNTIISHEIVQKLYFDLLQIYLLQASAARELDLLQASKERVGFACMLYNFLELACPVVISRQLS